MKKKKNAHTTSTIILFAWIVARNWIRAFLLIELNMIWIDNDSIQKEVYMGYTHYWSFNKKIMPAAELERVYQLALKDCARVARAYNAEAKQRGADMKRLSGYTAHCKPGQYGGLLINGKADEAHEDFALREHARENELGFCKTARKSYDVVVTACLAILKYRLGDAFIVSSDGRASDWNDGVDLARRILKRKILNPIPRERKERAA